MAEILSADFSSATLEALFQEKLKKGDLIGALLLTATMKANGYKKEQLCLKRAKVFYKMKRYELAVEEWFKYLSVEADEKRHARAYNGLGACFFGMGDKDLAGLYFEKQLRLNRNADYDYCDVTLKFYDEVLNRKNYYKIAYPYDKADFTELLEECDEYLKIGYYDKCIEKLSIIPENSRFYVDRLISESVANFLNENSERAVELIEKAHQLSKNNVSVICNAISIFTALKNKEKADYYFSLLNLDNLTESSNLYKVMMVSCEMQNHDLVNTLSTKYLKIFPYDLTALLVLGFSQYNLKEYKKAENTFKKCFQISSSPIHYYYYQVAEKASNGNVEYQKLHYAFDVPKKIRKAFLKQATELLMMPREEKIASEKDIQTLAHYAFYAGIYELQSSAVTLLGELGTKTSVKTLKDALLSINVFNTVKEGIIGYLVADGYEGELPVVFASNYRKLKVYKANFKNQNEKLFVEAYSLTLSKVANAENDLLPYKTSAENIYNKLSEKGLLSAVTDPYSLSATIYELAGTAKIVSRRGFAKFFKANLKTIKQIKTLIE